MHCQPHLGAAICNKGGSWEGRATKRDVASGRVVVVGHWFCQVRLEVQEQQTDADGASERDSAAEADKSEPTQGAARPPRCHVRIA